MKSVHFPAYYVFPFVTYVLIMITISFKFYELNSANFYQTQFKHDIMLFGLLQAFDLLSISLVHLLLFYVLCYPQNKFLQQRKLPTVTLNLPFLLYYVFCFAITLFDAESCREMQTDISIDHLRAYVFGIKQYFRLNYVFQGAKAGSGGMKVLADAIAANMMHWGLLFGFYLIVLIPCVVFLCLNFKIFLKQFSVYSLKMIKNQADIKEVQVNSTVIVEKEVFIEEPILPPKKSTKITIICFKKPVYNFFTLIQIAALVANLIVFGISMKSNSMDQINKFTPSYWALFRSASPEKLSNAEFNLAYNQFKAELPSDRYLLDQRQPPVYPLVTGTYEQFCSYNIGLCIPNMIKLTQKVDILPQMITMTAKYLNEKDSIIKAKKVKPQPKQKITPPNILFIAFESLSPSPKYLDPLFIDNVDNQRIIAGSPYSHQDFPNIKRISERAVNYLGMSSFGLPTINGWHSLFTSEKPKFKGINMVSHVGNQFESFMMKFKRIGYFTTYISPSPLDFDGKSNWLFNGMTDQVYFYVPTEKQCKWLNIENSTKNSWIGDRITTRQAILAVTMQFIGNGVLTFENASIIYGQELNISKDEASIILAEVQSLVNSTPSLNQPIQVVYMNVDTHTPFKGYDSPDQYNQFQTGDPYQTMIRSADYHIGRLIDYFLKIDPNTIVALTGDHGAREHPLYSAQQNISNQTYFDPRCVQQNSGNDNLFDTSGFISFNQLTQKNITLTIASDHDDLIYTLEKLVYNCWELSQPPTSRQGVDLISLLQSGNLTELEQKSSISSTHTIIEVRKSNNILRSSVFGSSGGFVVQSTYPTCLLKKHVIGTEMHQKAILKARFLSYLAQENRVWDDKFLLDCQFDVVQIIGTSCTLGVKNSNKLIITQDDFLTILLVTIFSGGFTVACILCYLTNKCDIDKMTK